MWLPDNRNREDVGPRLDQVSGESRSKAKEPESSWRGVETRLPGLEATHHSGIEGKTPLVDQPSDGTAVSNLHAAAWAKRVLAVFRTASARLASP